MASSSNPFRKSATQHPENRFPPMPSSVDAVQLFSPPTTTFRDENVPPAAAQSPAVDANKAKVVKKVRVLSPPPRTPESPEWTTSYFGSAAAPAYVPEQDPFNNVDNDWDDASAAAVAADSPSQPAAPPVRSPLMAVESQRPVNAVANPFSKKKPQEAADSGDSKEDAREEGEVLKAAQTARRSLNVDSFKRLLMTGAASPPSSPLPTDSFEHEPTDRPRPVSMPPPAREASTTVSAHKEKKAPPPPPSSRHGKVIKPVPAQSATGTESAVTSPKEKPAEPVAHPILPSRPPLSRESSASSGSSASSSSTASVEDEVVQMDTHPPALTASPEHIDTPVSPPASNVKKPVPVPPPRRQPRSDAKTTSPDGQENDPPPRSSMDSISSRSNSVRHSAHAPAPPPPRRTTSGSRHPATPQSSTLIHPPDTDTPRTSSESASRPMAPPPPPTRNASTRRPQSFYGLESSSHRRVVAEIKPRDVVAPPPPPSRIRGSSQSSADGQSARASLDSARKPRSSADEFGDLGDAQYAGQTVDILADLESLQREVDALRGRMS
ncbi:hypothetical protein CCMA1212_000211 [Trichoderma ghanense]|uniref:Uncharacterized protein n=1 Tax=Trichoderma ghanense TaxID=65468 RepID=A0ABY2HH21_9HYPO